MKNKDQILLEQAYKSINEADASKFIKTKEIDHPTVKGTEFDLRDVSVYDLIQSIENGEALEKGSSAYFTLIAVNAAIQRAKSSHSQTSKENSNKRMVEFLPERPGDKPIYQK